MKKKVTAVKTMKSAYCTPEEIRLMLPVRPGHLKDVDDVVGHYICPVKLYCNQYFQAREQVGRNVTSHDLNFFAKTNIEIGGL